MAWKCPLCVVFTSLTLNLLLSHFNSQHSGDTVTIRCRFDSCDKDYNKVNSFVKHVRDRHRKHLLDPHDDDSEDRHGIVGELIII